MSDSKLNETVDYDDCNCVGDYVAYEECVTSKALDDVLDDLGYEPNECEEELLQDPNQILNAYLVFNNKFKSERETVKRFGVNGWQDCSDAFRHSLWNALNVVTIGIGIAEIFANAHECDRSDRIDTQMDLHNNREGRTIGSSNYHFKKVSLMADKICASMELGNMQVVLNPTSSDALISSEDCQCL